jgi:hypothetical protein
LFFWNLAVLLTSTLSAAAVIAEVDPDPTRKLADAQTQGNGDHSYFKYGSHARRASFAALAAFASGDEVSSSLINTLCDQVRRTCGERPNDECLHGIRIGALPV